MYPLDMGAMPKLPPSGFDELSPEEQIDYIQALWGRVAAHPESVPSPAWHHQIVAERLAEYRTGEAGTGRPWSEVRRELEAELRRARG